MHLGMIHALANHAQHIQNGLLIVLEEIHDGSNEEHPLLREDTYLVAPVLIIFH
jgi:hypothetical protein